MVETPPTPFADRILETELSKATMLSDIESFIAKVTVPPPPPNDDGDALDGGPMPARKDLKKSSHDFSGELKKLFLKLKLEKLRAPIGMKDLISCLGWWHKW